EVLKSFAYMEVKSEDRKWDAVQTSSVAAVYDRRVPRCGHPCEFRLAGGARPPCNVTVNTRRSCRCRASAPLAFQRFGGHRPPLQFASGRARLCRAGHGVRSRAYFVTSRCSEIAAVNGSAKSFNFR